MLSVCFATTLRAVANNSMKNKNSTHVYDLGKFQFNKSTDVDMLEYNEIQFGQPSLKKSANFKVGRTTTVAEFSVPHYESVKLVVPYENPKNATKAFLEGLKTTIEKVNEHLSGFIKSQINVNKFEVVELDRIKTSTDDFELFLPVDVKTSVVTSQGSFEVSINFDNPTSLAQGQENGSQGSHFGYTITGSGGQKIRGHVLITTFSGFPSRGGFPSRDETFKLPSKSSTTKFLNFGELCKVALAEDSLQFDITTEKGIDDNQSPCHSERIKQLPLELQRIHNTFAGKHFSLPSKKNISQVCDR